MRLRLSGGAVGLVLVVSSSIGWIGTTLAVVVVGELVDNVTLCRPLRVGMDGQAHLLNVLVSVVARLVDGRLLLVLLWTGELHN